MIYDSVLKKTGLCPFCGGFSTSVNSTKGEKYLTCDDCGASGPASGYSDHEARLQWHDRQSPGVWQPVSVARESNYYLLWPQTEVGKLKNAKGERWFETDGGQIFDYSSVTHVCEVESPKDS